MNEENKILNYLKFLSEKGKKPLVPKCVNLVKEYIKNGSIWKPKIHFLYPSSFRNKVLFFLLSIKNYFKTKNNFCQLPKPLINYIVFLISVNNGEKFFKNFG